MQALQTKGLTPDLPPPGLAKHLIDYLFEIGPSVPLGMSAGPIGWTDIAAWQTATGIDLTAWEARTLRALSADYVGTAATSLDDNTPAPYTIAPTPDRRELVANQVRAIFGGRTPSRSQ